MNPTPSSPDNRKLNSPHIAVVILNYNSEMDLQICAEQISRQEGVCFSIILVDNASNPESLNAFNSWLACWRSDIVSGTSEIVHAWVQKNPTLAAKSGNVYLIKNIENRGYSAGNNIGIRLAEALHADAVLIANPDVRIEDTSYLAELSRQLFADQHNLVVASRIIDLDGNDQNPLREASFLEEVFWPRWLLRSFLKTKSYIIPCPPDRPTVVSKVSGCCLLLRMDFLQSTRYLDEQVFLYCEEPIISARVRKMGGMILYVPMVKAIHAHVRSKKGDSTKRMLLFIQSRKYYLKTYSNYNPWQLLCLFLSYDVLAGYNRLKGFGKKLLLCGGKNRA